MDLAVDQGLPTFFKSHLTSDAITIARRTTIGERIADAYIVAATAKAGEWYGVDDPNELLGGWLSLLQHREDARLGRILALARHCGQTTPKTYVSRVRQIRDETFRPVTKEVTQIILGGDTYLVTTLSEAEAPPLAEERGIFERYAVSDPVETEQFLGQLSVAETTEVIAENIGQGSTNSVALPFHPDYGLELGATVRIDERSWVHRCARCTGTWKSEELEPDRCGKRGCQVSAWKNLDEPFRTMCLEGRPVTPAMIRETRQRKVRNRKGRK